MLTQSPVTSPPLSTDRLAPLCEALLQADPDIRDIVMFGSATYAPDLARDVDLLVITAFKKDEDIYVEATADWPTDVDILVKEPGETIGGDIALSVYATRYVLYGHTECFEEIIRDMPIPTYTDARNHLLLADRQFQGAQQEQDEWMRHKLYCLTFDALFHGARHAAMTFLCTDNQRWGDLRRALPDLFAERFRQMINTLHILYSYDGKYPQDRVDEEFHRWRGIVQQFIQDIENAGSTASQSSDADVS